MLTNKRSSVSREISRDVGCAIIGTGVYADALSAVSSRYGIEAVGRNGSGIEGRRSASGSVRRLADDQIRGGGHATAGPCCFHQKPVIRGGGGGEAVTALEGRLALGPRRAGDDVDG